MSPDQILRADLVAHAHDRIAEAENLYKRGNALVAQKKPDEAIAAYGQAIVLRADFAEAHFALGIALVNRRRFAEAIGAYRTVIALRPDAPEPYFNLAIALTAQGAPRDAIAPYRQAIALKPNFAEAYLNLGVLLRELGQADELIELSRRALAVKPDFPEMHFNLGVTFAAQGRLDEAIETYRRAIALKPDFPEPYCGLGLALVAQMRLEDAVAAYRQAVRLRPDFYEAHQNLGVALRDLGRVEEAIEACRAAVSLRPDNVAALVNLGTLLRDQWQLEEALAVYRRAVVIDPGAIKAGAQPAMLRRALCDWSEYDADLARVLARHDEVEPFILFTMSSTPAQQPASARTWAAKFARGPAFIHPPARAHGRIRLGYLSADFHRHATAYLMAELFERHDRARFEVFGYSYGADDGSEMRRGSPAGSSTSSSCARRRTTRRRAASMATASISSSISRAYTGNTRTEILVDPAGAGPGRTISAFRAPWAPPSSTISLPTRSWRRWTSRNFSARRSSICRIAINPTIPSARSPSPRRPRGMRSARTGRGLLQLQRRLQDRACRVRDLDAAVARGARQRVVALVDEFPDRRQSAPRRRCARRRSAPHRLLSALAPAAASGAPQERRFVPRHAAGQRAHDRKRRAVGGFAARDVRGGHFISRVAGSLLTAVGLPELVTYSLADYEALALDLAANPGKLAAVKEKLARHRLSSRLFDIDRFTRNIEAAYQRMHELRAAGQAPQSFAIAAG